MPAQITELIDKIDGSEAVGDMIAAILLLELENQQALATTAGKDPNLWKVRVFRERTNPIEDYLNLDQVQTHKPKDPSPIVNVWFDGGQFDKRTGNTVERQKCTGRFNLDVYGHGVSHGLSTGHKPGDLDAADNRSRALRLVRNILMSGQYTYLGDQRGANQFIWGRWPDSITNFQPAIDDRPVENVKACRFVLVVEFNEYAPQVKGELLELISVGVKRKETGEVYLTANYPIT